MAGFFGGMGNVGKALVGGALDATEDVLQTTEKTVKTLSESFLGKDDDSDMEEDDYQDSGDNKSTNENEDEAEAKLLKKDQSGDTAMEEEDEEEKEEEEEEEDEEEEEQVTMIPKHSSLKSLHNNNYLLYTNQDDQTRGFLRFSGDKVVSPFSKFEFRASKSDKKLVHIRCCYNNKFFVRSSPDSNYIVALANEEQEDQSKFSCTLFEPIYNLDRDAYRLRHVQLNAFIGVDESAPQPHTNCLVASNQEGVFSLFKVVDWDSIFILPKYVAFKSDNGSFLQRSGKYLAFSASDAEGESTAHEIIATRDGYIRIKHVASGKYWVRDPNWIWLKDIDTSKDDPNALFWPVKADNNVVALRNMGNNQFCKRLTADGKTNCLNAGVRTISENARMEVMEIVESRSIEDVEYRLEDARIYGKNVLSVSKGVAVNKTEVADQVSFKFRYEQKKETTWSSSVSTTLGATAKFTSKIPTVGMMKVELSAEVSNENSWGETQKEKSFEETTQTVTIPPNSKVKIDGIITEAKCDVPFSYTRRDTLKNGKQVSRRFHDGLFTGVNTFDFKFETEQVAN